MCVAKGTICLTITTGASTSGIVDVYVDDGSWMVFDPGFESTGYVSCTTSMKGEFIEVHRCDE